MRDNKSVYIVDDDPFVRKSLLALVVANGLVGRGFSSGEEFLSFADSTLEGCIVSDIRLGGINGYQLRNALIQKGVKTPLILITGFTDSMPRLDPQVTVLEKTCSSEVLLQHILANLED